MNVQFLDTTDADESRKDLLLVASSRALALFFGGFSLLNFAGNFRLAGFDANLWWIDLRAIPGLPAAVFLLVASAGLVAFALRPPRSPWRRFLTGGIAFALGLASFWNILEYYSLLARGRVQTLLPVPFSALVLTAMVLIFLANSRRARPARPPRFSRALLTAFVACVLAFPIAQMFCFGKTDYRRAADVAVVLGARTYKDGRPSDALTDRVRTACGLYRDGLAKKIIFSGGPGNGSVSEPDAMRNLALRLGVKADDILIDNSGLNTQATVRNTTALFRQLGARRVLVVSHFYHLPRIKLAYQRAGWDVYTVPAKEPRFFWKMPYFVARETAAVWAYYLRPLVG
jgi:uncharacterized SAM-binding protein YcdF (DUF218 family)